MATNEALIRAYESQSAFLRERVVAYTLSVWAAARAFRDADVDRIVAQIVPAVQAGQLQLATLTDAYIGQVARRAGVPWVPSLDRTVTTYRGVDPAEVYRRPAVEVYSALAAGAAYPDAVSAGGNRLLSLVSTDLQQARNRQATSSIGGTGYTQFKRVLAGKGDCALCVIASTQLYNRGDLMPIHPGCDCGVEPFDGDPSFDADASARLESLHSEVESRFGGSDRGGRDLGIDKRDAKGRSLSDYTDLIVSREHGEYGPTLAWRSQNFTSAADIPAL